jgi:SAM-dependent methyltransferase
MSPRPTQLHGTPLASSFGLIAAEYDAARPGYPAELFDAIEELAGFPLRGARVLDVGAGTGKATRRLRDRGAAVVAVEPTPGMAEQFRAVTPDVPLVRSDGDALPFADGCADLVSYAQAFHWTDPARSVPEAMRVLRPAGALALFWNVKDRSVDWLGEQERRLRRNCEAFHPFGDSGDALRVLREQGVQATGTVLHWTRTVPVEQAVQDIGSRSYCAVLPPEQRAVVLEVERRALLEVFPDGVVVEPYRVDLTVAVRGV